MTDRPEVLRGSRRMRPEQVTEKSLLQMRNTFEAASTVAEMGVLDQDQVASIEVAAIEALADYLGRDDDGGDRLRGCALASRRLDDLICAEVDDRRGQGESWSAIAACLGISKQAAHQRFGRENVSRGDS